MTMRAAVPATGPGHCRPKPCPRKHAGHCGTPSPGSPSTLSPGRTGSPPSCAASCSMPLTTANPWSWTSATAPAFPATSAGRCNFGQGIASGRAAVSRQRIAIFTTCAIRPTAARLLFETAFYYVSITMIFAFTGGAGAWSCTPTERPPRTGRAARSCTATGHRVVAGHQVARIHRTEAGHQAAGRLQATRHQATRPRSPAPHAVARAVSAPWPSRFQRRVSAVSGCPPNVRGDPVRDRAPRMQ
jgi:hypothetical protein